MLMPHSVRYLASFLYSSSVIVQRRSTASGSSTEAECFSDFNYWRYPPPPITVEGACETIATDMDEETETYNDFSFWRLPPSPLQQPPRPASPGEGVREMRREWLEVEGPSEDEDDNVPDPMSMLSGNAGMRLLGLLGQLSQHLESVSCREETIRNYKREMKLKVSYA